EAPRLLFTENETNVGRLYGTSPATPYVKDAFHRAVIHGELEAVNPQERGTKVAAWYLLRLPAGGSAEIRLRLTSEPDARDSPFGPEFDATFAERIREADAFYERLLGPAMTADEKLVARQASAGLLWSKQYYHYVVGDWLQGDPDQPQPPAARASGRNADWKHVFNRDVISMPDTWEYPWFAAWDLAFHMIPFAVLDPQFA